jgi:hypothetical protein
MFPATQHYAAVGDTCNQNKCFDPFPGKAEMEIRSYLKLESCLLTEAYMILLFLFSNFRRVLKVICFFFWVIPWRLNSDTEELPRRKHTT